MSTLITPATASDVSANPTPARLPKTLQIPKGTKVFLNIAWDKHVPAPPPVDEAVVRRAMMGEDLEDGAGIGEGAYYVPVVVSEPREATDKSGKSSIVFDWKLEARSVLIPKTLLYPSGVIEAPPKPLMQEISVSPGNTDNVGEDKGKPKTAPKSILKSTPAAKPLIEDITNTESDFSTLSTGDPVDKNVLSSLSPPCWKWTKDGKWLKIEIDVPGLTRNLHSQSTLDIEPRRILLHIPQTHFLDINLDLPDAQIGKINGSWVEEVPDTAAVAEINADTLRIKGHNAGEALRLKRQRNFDIESAQAEWRVGEEKLIILA
ncbi:hypothetical protein DFH11DRAFT_1788451 [Phellopilus nigrolimitatus]|nr:hypothetical protein DFH11DRAFT_1788451 [Phellopilus nigrolimitatus]